LIINVPFFFPIIEYQPENGLALAEALCPQVKRLEQNDQHGGILSEGWSTSARASSSEDYKKGGYTSFYTHRIMDMPEFVDVHHAASEAFSNYLKVIKRDNEPFYLPNSWVSSYGRGHFVPEHVHSFCHLSCVFYAAATAGTGRILFRDPAESFYDMLQDQSCTIFAPVYRLQPKIGHFGVFPSFMRHHTEPHHADEKRIIFSANMILSRSYLGQRNRPGIG
jgi:uncharacterized protein (TIGR02466 family)